MIRADDQLWARVTSAAERLGWSISHFVRETLWRATEEHLCVICGEPASVQRSVDIDGWVSETFEDTTRRMASGDRSDAKRSLASVNFTVCAAHDDGVSDYFLDRIGGIQGYTLIRKDSGPISRERVDANEDHGYRRMAEIMDKLNEWSV